MKQLLDKFTFDGDGKFGAVRKHDIHTGIDLYCEENSSVYAVKDGIIVNIEEFTGVKADSPWWNDTKAILIECGQYVICYGEIEPNNNLYIGKEVKAGEEIGRVKRVLKKDKGLPTTMLHLEVYKPGTKNTVWWKHGEQKPNELLDPTFIIVGVPIYVKLIYRQFVKDNSLVYISMIEKRVCGQCKQFDCNCSYIYKRPSGHTIIKEYTVKGAGSLNLDSLEKFGIKINEDEINNLKSKTVGIIKNKSK